MLGNFWRQDLFGEMDAVTFTSSTDQGISHLLHPDALARFDRNALR